MNEKLKTREGTQEITRKKALKKISHCGKYMALTALSTFLILNPQKAQATSIDPPGSGF